MSDYLYWYLVELRIKLGKHFTEQRLDEIVKEVESHLRQSVKEIMVLLDCDEEKAVLSAIEAFGKPEKVARTYLAEADPRCFGFKPIWVVLVSALVATLCWDFHWMTLDRYFDNFGATWQNGLAGVIGFIALGVLVKACRSGYRSYAVPLLGLSAATAFCLVFVLSFWMVGSTTYSQGISRFHMGRDVQKIRGTLVKLDQLDRYLADGVKIFADAKSPKDIPREYRSLDIAERHLGLQDHALYSFTSSGDARSAYTAPKEGIFAMVDGRMWPLDGESDFFKACKQWHDKSAAAAKSIQFQRQEFQKLLASADEAYAGRIFFFNSDVYKEPVLETLLFLVALLLADGLAFLLRIRRSWPGSKIATN